MALIKPLPGNLRRANKNWLLRIGDDFFSLSEETLYSILKVQMKFLTESFSNCDAF